MSWWKLTINDGLINKQTLGKAQSQHHPKLKCEVFYTGNGVIRSQVKTDRCVNLHFIRTPWAEIRRQGLLVSLFWQIFSPWAWIRGQTKLGTFKAGTLLHTDRFERRIRSCFMIISASICNSFAVFVIIFEVSRWASCMSICRLEMAKHGAMRLF